MWFPNAKLHMAPNSVFSTHEVQRTSSHPVNWGDSMMTRNYTWPESTPKLCFFLTLTLTTVDILCTLWFGVRTKRTWKWPELNQITSSSTSNRPPPERRVDTCVENKLARIKYLNERLSRRFTFVLSIHFCPVNKTHAFTTIRQWEDSQRCA